MSYQAIESAISDGRILPKSRRRYETLMAKHPKKTKRFLKSLTPALSGRSSSAADSLADTDDGETDYLTAGLTPGERARIAESSYDTAASAAASPPPVPAPRAKPSASEPVPPTAEAYPPEWLTAKERSGPSGDRGHVTIVSD
jgi:hypothetical protein